MASEGRKMYDVRVYNLKCVECGKPVDELPFQPLTSTRPVYCRDCNQNRRPAKKKPYRGKPKRRRR
jgi:CxxC-x17-CxxC domain-containing protein